MSPRRGTRTQPCGLQEARTRLASAEKFLDVARLIDGEPEAAFWSVAATLAVLAGIAASDAACCSRHDSARRAAHARASSREGTSMIENPPTRASRTPSRHTAGMKVAISIPDDVFEDAERLARRLGISRSLLYSRALRDFVARYEPDHVTAALDVVVAVEPEGDAFTTRAGRRMLERDP